MHISCLYSWTIPHMWLSKIHNFIAQNGYLSTTFTNTSKRHRKYNNYESAQVSFSLVQIWGTCILYLSISISRYISQANTLLLTSIYSSDRFSHRLLFRQVLVLQLLGRCSYSNATTNILKTPFGLSIKCIITNFVETWFSEATNTSRTWRIHVSSKSQPAH